MVITRIAPMSAARIAGVLYALMGLFIGLGISALTMFGGGLPGGTDAAASPIAGIAFGTAAVFMLPMLYGFFGFLSTLLGAAFYNALARTLGGIEIETASSREL